MRARDGLAQQDGLTSAGPDAPLVERLAAVMHDLAHQGWHRWYLDGRECPDGTADSDAWLRKAEDLHTALVAAGLTLR